LQEITMRKHHQTGFSLLEMMISVAILIVVSGAAFSALSASQRVYASQQLQADMHAGLRGTLELMEQEVGQAGALNFPPQTLTGAVVGTAVAQTVPVTSSANIYVGELLTVDTGAAQEVVQVTGVGTNQVTGVFQQSHPVNAPVVAQGVLPQGVLTTVAGNQLQIVGDVNADGTLEFVEYDCNPGTPAAPGTLTRSITTIAPGVVKQNAPQILLNTLVANPNGTPCFTPSMGVGGAVTAGNCALGGTAFTCVTEMQITLTVQAAEPDPQTGQYQTMTKSFLNVSSRNVFAAYMIAATSGSQPGLLQPQPPGLPLAP
jgi:prepilin-type N-terminal cleavage/methylation domain-containing protein